MEYQRDVQDIARYTEPNTEFERSVIIETADRHGEDPATVARDVNHARKLGAQSC